MTKNTIPEGYSIQERPGAMALRKKLGRVTSKEVSLVVFALAAVAGLGYLGMVFYEIGLEKYIASDRQSVKYLVVGIVFLSSFTLTPLCLLYYLLLKMLNSRVIIVNGQALKIRYGPLPWPGGKTVRRSDFQKLELIESSRSYSDTDMTSLPDKAYRVFLVVADMKDASRRELLRFSRRYGFWEDYGTDPETEALYIVHTIQKFMGRIPPSSSS